jgi:hypothetical protein
MSVRILSPKDVIARLDHAQLAGPPVTKNFLHVFSSAGCLLNCEDEKTLTERLPQNQPANLIAQSARMERKKVRSTRREHWAEFREVRKEWFTASEISASVLQGCGSCTILKSILLQLFFPDQDCLPGDYEFSVASNFEIRQRKAGAEESVEVIQLFQPLGM